MDEKLNLDGIVYLDELLDVLHHASFRNENDVKISTTCGCFHCMKIFDSKEVTNWCDQDGKGPATARCPYCGIDSVMTDHVRGNTIGISPDLLDLMHSKFFG